MIAATRNWVSRFVVGHDVCPFAARELRRDSIRYQVLAADDFETALLTLIEACRALDASPAIETTLLILPRGVDEFEDYLDLLDLAEALLEAEGYSGVYQLASFHPDYCFDGAEPDDPANATNRSPWPMLHLLREASVSRALDNYPDPQAIPERNVALMRRLGNARLDAERAACQSVGEA
ncbi:DUF1415 domain-containing protein [Halomonas sp. HP20-15]|uniref:DUF1415 domain-containing protein n=1 Tax=Halomonas sp. HP20-15 TaxID=3085901 RepID=UPI00298164E6|nr:DUF1415 domain-containing protein [Halomonas sp. HP20-15]MDW5376578.1 DUF1415 domain-containing protein [Halomonas sp. HP20-15]